jgi:hypothetical protein
VTRQCVRAASAGSAELRCRWQSDSGWTLDLPLGWGEPFDGLRILNAEILWMGKFHSVVVDSKPISNRV